MPSELSFPGLKRRKRKNGSEVGYWVARADLVKAGYEPQTVRIPYDLEDPELQILISATCLKLQAEMLEWSSGHKRDLNRFDGTILGLSRRYQTDPASPFLTSLKHTTRKKDLYTLKLIERAFGGRSLASLKVGDFRRWYDEAKKPKPTMATAADDEAPPKERVRRAYGIIKKIREMVSYGVMAELPECERLAKILAEARFKQPAPRRNRMELEHVLAFADKARELGRQSLALATAIQFETLLRQRDVIGEWEPIPEGQAATGIILNGRRWVNGLTWADLANELVMRKATTKTGAMAAHDFKLLTIVVDLLNEVPSEQRVGPLIVDERSGRPYAEGVFTREWRVVAKAAGIPDDVWNMDARAGAITEADDAGAELDQIRSTAAHAQASTTVRYLRGGVGKSRAVATLRAAHRANKNKA